jgi:hypothetical protein
MVDTIMLNGNLPVYDRDFLTLPGECQNQFQEQMRQIRDGVTSSDFWSVCQKFHETMEKFEDTTKGIDIISAGNDTSKDIMENDALKGIMKYTSKVMVVANEEQLVESALEIAQEKLFGEKSAGPSMR